VNEDIIETLRRIQCSDVACGNLRIAMGLKLAIYEIERLRAERDDARREICQLKGTVRWNHYFPHFDPKGYAKNRGWDCHKDYK